MNSRTAITVNRPPDEVERLWRSAEYRPAYIDEAWWIALFPGLALFLTVSAYNLLAEGLRTATTEKGPA